MVERVARMIGDAEGHALGAMQNAFQVAMDILLSKNALP